MSTEVAPLTSVQDAIRDKIKAEFVGLIPDAMWTAMVASVIKEFTEDRPDPYRSHEKITAPLKKMIRDELEALARAKLKGELERLSHGAWDGYGNMAASEAINKLIDEHFHTLIISVQTGMVQMAVMQAVQNIRNSMR